MPGWTGCDVCEVIDALRLVLGETSLPDPSTFKDPQLQALERRLQAEKDAPLSSRALIVAEGLREVGMTDIALQISVGMPRIVSLSDPTSATLLGRALIIQARALNTLGKAEEASSAFAMAEHLHTLAGRTQQ
jgi:hypothetical protein